LHFSTSLRLSIPKQRKELPTFYSDNYISVLPGETKKLRLITRLLPNENATAELYVWNVEEMVIEIK